MIWYVGHGGSIVVWKGDLLMEPAVSVDLLFTFTKTDSDSVSFFKCFSLTSPYRRKHVPHPSTSMAVDCNLQNWRRDESWLNVEDLFDQSLWIADWNRTDSMTEGVVSSTHNDWGSRLLHSPWLRESSPPLSCSADQNWFLQKRLKGLRLWPFTIRCLCNHSECVYVCMYV